MSFYSMICIEVVKDVWSRIIAKLKERNGSILYRPLSFYDSDTHGTILMVFLWNHAPPICDITDYMFDTLGLDYHDFNITSVDESDKVCTDGLLDVHYTCTDDKGEWRAEDSEYGKSTIVFDGIPFTPSYRLTDEEYAQHLADKRMKYTE